MLADLVSRHHIKTASPSPARTSPPPTCPNPRPVDAVLFLHGDTGHFYASLYLELGQRMAEQGIAFLTGNRRGHDHVANGVRGGPLAGYAFESVDDARADFAAWLELLRERGHRRIAIGGHSGGAVRAAYAQATERFDNVVAVIPVSPGEYNHEGVVALHGEDFAGPFRDSEQNVAEGRPDVADPTGRTMGLNVERPRLRRLLQSGQPLQRDPPRRANTGCPTLFIFGAEECAIGGPQELPVCGAARRSVEAAEYPHVQVHVIRRRPPRLHGPRARALQHNARLAPRALARPSRGGLSLKKVVQRTIAHCLEHTGHPEATLDPAPSGTAELGLDNGNISSYILFMRRKLGAIIPIERSILAAMVSLRAQGVADCYGFLLAKEIADSKGARLLTGHGTLYKALGRLEQQGFLESSWEDQALAVQQHRPPRKLYRLTALPLPNLAEPEKDRQPQSLRLQVDS